MDNTLIDIGFTYLTLKGNSDTKMKYNPSLHRTTGDGLQPQAQFPRYARRPLNFTVRHNREVINAT